MAAIEVREYVTEEGKSPFGRWFDKLDAQAATKVTTALERLTQGNLSSVKGVGEGLMECRIDWGPGLRIYFGRDGDVLIILVGGGTKKRQSNDIHTAKQHWAEYRQHKKREK